MLQVRRVFVPPRRGREARALGRRLKLLSHELAGAVAEQLRVDVGTHARADLDGLAEPSESRKQTCFVNEVEIVPTLYLAAKFGHRQDYVAAYGRALLKTAFEACGREAPAPGARGSRSYKARAAGHPASYHTGGARSGPPTVRGQQGTLTHRAPQRPPPPEK